MSVTPIRPGTDHQRAVSSARVDNALRVWPPRVTAAALAFEARWTRNTLRRVDAALAKRFDRQVELYAAAIEGGTAEDIETHGAAMVRGYAVCASVLAKLGIGDDAYVVGRDAGGFTIAVGNQRAAVARVRERFGADVAFFTADELATLLAGLPGAVAAADVKAVFPGAEVVDVRNGAPAHHLHAEELARSIAFQEAGDDGGDADAEVIE